MIFLTDIAFHLIKPFTNHHFCLLFKSAADIQVHFRLDFIIEEYTMNLAQTDSKKAAWQSDLGPYYLHYRLPKYNSRRDSRQQKL